MRKNFLSLWGITPAQFSDLLYAHPSLRGFNQGYVAEKILRDVLNNSGKVESIHRDDDHKRDKRGDFLVKYRGETLGIEVKSIQSGSIKILSSAEGGRETWVPKFVRIETEPDVPPDRIPLAKDGKPKKYKKTVENPDFARELLKSGVGARLRATVQVDGSDSTAKTSAGGEDLGSTVNYVVGGFEILAVSYFSMFDRWEFGFALNEDLPRKEMKDGSQSAHLLKNSFQVEWPSRAPFTNDLFSLLDRLIEERRPK